MYRNLRLQIPNNSLKRIPNMESAGMIVSVTAMIDAAIWRLAKEVAAMILSPSNNHATQSWKDYHVMELVTAGAMTSASRSQSIPDLFIAT